VIGLVTELTTGEQNAAAVKAAPMAAGAPPARGVPSAAAGVAVQAEDGGGAPSALVPPGRPRHDAAGWRPPRELPAPVHHRRPWGGQPG
jgi:hypothetical protein